MIIILALTSMNGRHLSPCSRTVTNNQVDKVTRILVIWVLNLLSKSRRRGRFHVRSDMCPLSPAVRVRVRASRCLLAGPLSLLWALKRVLSRRVGRPIGFFFGPAKPYARSKWINGRRGLAKPPSPPARAAWVSPARRCRVARAGRDRLRAVGRARHPGRYLVDSQDGRSRQEVRPDRGRSRTALELREGLTCRWRWTAHPPRLGRRLLICALD